MWACGRDVVNSSCAVTYLDIWRSSTYPEKRNALLIPTVNHRMTELSVLGRPFLGLKICLTPVLKSEPIPRDIHLMLGILKILPASLTLVLQATLG